MNNGSTGKSDRMGGEQRASRAERQRELLLPAPPFLPLIFPFSCRPPVIRYEKEKRPKGTDKSPQAPANLPSALCPHPQ